VSLKVEQVMNNILDHFGCGPKKLVNKYRLYSVVFHMDGFFGLQEKGFQVSQELSQRMVPPQSFFPFELYFIRLSARPQLYNDCFAQSVFRQ
jgi:hypothetical protein